MGLLKLCPKNICPPTVATYTFHIPLLRFKIAAHFSYTYLITWQFIFLEKLSVCHTATKSFAFIIPNVHYHVHNSLPLHLYTARSIQSQRAPSVFILSSHLSLSPLMFSLSLSLNQNLLTFLNCTR